MLYTFGLSNYKSYDLSKDYTDQLLDLCPADLRSKQEHINTEGLLRTAVIFGSNAAGKSNMVDGLRFIKGLYNSVYRHPVFGDCLISVCYQSSSPPMRM